MPDYVTIKLHADTRRLLRLIAAQSGEQMVQVMHRLCEDEWRRIKATNGTNERSVAPDPTTPTAPESQE